MMMVGGCQEGLTTESEDMGQETFVLEGLFCHLRAMRRVVRASVLRRVQLARLGLLNSA